MSSKKKGVDSSSKKGASSRSAKTVTKSRTVDPTVRRSGVFVSDESRCREITGTHGRCKNKVAPNSTFCSRHQRRLMQHEDRSFDSTFAYVDKGIWIGSIDTVHDPLALQSAGIKTIVNISGFEPRTEIRNMFRKHGIQYHTLTTRDRHGRLKYLGDERIGGRLSLGEFYNYMDKGVEMIRSSQKPVLVNCYAGINRSASLVSAYLISQYGMPFSVVRQKLMTANKKRTIPVLTNGDFVKAISRYDDYLRSRS